MPYTATITNFPTNLDPINLTVEATLTDGITSIVRGYSLPTSDKPTPSDFEALIQADVDQLNQSAKAQAAFQDAFTADTSVSIPINTEQAAQAESRARL